MPNDILAGAVTNIAHQNVMADTGEEWYGITVIMLQKDIDFFLIKVIATFPLSAACIFLEIRMIDER